MAPPSSDAPVSASASTEHADTSAAATADTAEPKSISLNVRTLDHTTYPITIISNATVLQLKELVAVATGVVFARQRLIFRGKVLKNDQNIAAYSLDDGHTLHLVVRADAAVASASDSSSTSTNTSTSSNTGTTSPATTAPVRRNNDEPDPTIGSASSGPNHVVMGATIALGDGANVSMPFLSSMIANIMTSAHGMPGHIVISETEPSGASTGTAGGHRASYAHFTTRAGARDGSSVRARRSRAEPSLRSLSGGSSSSSRSRTSATSSTGSSSSMTSGLANLRSRSEHLMETVRSNIENSDYDFTGLDELQLETTTETDAAFLQAQLTQLEILLEHFRTRLHLLPVALRVLQRRSAASASNSSSADDVDVATDTPLPSVSAIVRTIDTLQSVGESVDILARIARYLFIRHNPAFTGGRTRLSDGESVRITAGSASTGESTSVTINTAAASATSASSTAAAGAPTDLSDNSISTRRSSSERRSSSHRRRHASSRSETARGASDSGRSGGNALLSLLERMNESIRGATGGFMGASSETPSSSAASASTAEPSSTAASTTSSSAVSTGTAPPSTNSSSNSSLPLGFDQPQLSVASFDIPLGSVVFPISFSDVNAPTTTATWNFAELVSRLVHDLPSSHFFGVVSGDPVSLHQVMAQLGLALVSGVDVPPVSRATIRTWSHALVAELRSQLRAHGVPAQTLALVDAHQQSSFVDQLIRPIEPFVPDLVDSLLRATSASRTAAFGTSSAAFLATMSRQFVRHMRTYVGRDDETLARVLQSLVEHLGLDSRLAAFAVGTFLDWAGSESAATSTSSSASGSRSTRRRERDGSASGASEPANKRRRGE